MLCLRGGKRSGRLIVYCMKGMDERDGELDETGEFFMKTKKQCARAAAALALSVVLTLFAACALAQTAYINNGSDPASMLNLREQPDKGARALGKFLSGTQVEIVGDAGNGWSEVQIGSGRGVIGGYMMTSYLAANGTLDATQARAVASPYGTQSVVLRDEPSNSYDAVAMLAVGESVQVIGEMNEFRFVRTSGGCVGCLLASELK